MTLWPPPLSQILDPPLQLSSTCTPTLTNLQKRLQLFEPAAITSGKLMNMNECLCLINADHFHWSREPQSGSKFEEANTQGHLFGSVCRWAACLFKPCNIRVGKKLTTKTTLVVKLSMFLLLIATSIFSTTTHKVTFLCVTDYEVLFFFSIKTLHSLHTTKTTEKKRWITMKSFKEQKYLAWNDTQFTDLE